MIYHKITITLTPDNQDFRDILIATLGVNGFESFVENETSVEAFIPSEQFNTKSLNLQELTQLFEIDFTTELIAEQNWNEVWEKNYFKPLLVADQCLIRAPFHTEYPNAKYEIIIEPKMAFGTGNHETTSLMIEHILEINLEGKKILDMGCGTGVLAMLASKRMAREVTAIDIDHWSVESTTENAAMNNCSNITVLHGDSTLLTDQTFDVIFANIHKNILLDDMQKYVSVLKVGGLLLISGFYENDLNDILQSTMQNQLRAMQHKMKNKWVAAKFQK